MLGFDTLNVGLDTLNSSGLGVCLGMLSGRLQNALSHAVQTLIIMFLTVLMLSRVEGVLKPSESIAFMGRTRFPGSFSSRVVFKKYIK